jgi:glyoxylase-like metal-dependent hydrolase (beta-lactamase superfamily II)
MNSLESQLAYPFGEALPERGTTIEVAPGVHWLRMGLPFQLDHINLWLLRDELEEDGVVRQGWSIVDSGIDDPATRAAWEKVFATVLGGLPVLRVIVTHMHPDHIGCAHWLCERWNVRLWISATDFNVARLASSASAGFGGPLSAASWRSTAWPRIPTPSTRSARAPTTTGAWCRRCRQLPAAVRRRQRRDRQRRAAQPWTCHAGFGHAPEHMALHDATHGVLISGDMVLPRISTNVSVIDVEPEADSLTLYLESIERMRAIPADTLVLPSHGRPFKGLHTRIDQLQQHHDARFVDVLEALAAKGRRAPSSWCR